MLRDKLNIALQNAKNELQEHVVRLILTALKDQDINARESGNDEGLTEIEVIKILTTMIEQRENDITNDKYISDNNIIKRKKNEIAIIKEFMPLTCNDAEAEEMCKLVINDINAKGIKDMGQTVEVLLDRMEGRLEFSRAKSIALRMLS